MQQRTISSKAAPIPSQAFVSALNHSTLGRQHKVEANQACSLPGMPPVAVQYLL